MPTTIRRELLPGVRLTCLQDTQLQTSSHGMHLLSPLDSGFGALNALLPQVLLRGTATLPNRTALAVALEQMGGGQIHPSCRKVGELQAFGFTAQFPLGDTDEGHPQAMEAIHLLGDLLLRPNTRYGRFNAAYVEQEKGRLLRALSQWDTHPERFLPERLDRLLFDQQAAALSPLGEATQLAGVNNQKLFRYWQKLLPDAPLELYYSGPAPWQLVADCWRDALVNLPRSSPGMPENFPLPPEFGMIRSETLRSNVKPGYIGMAFSSLSPLDYTGYASAILLGELLATSTESCRTLKPWFDFPSGLLSLQAALDPQDLARCQEQVLLNLSNLELRPPTDSALDIAKRQLTLQMSLVQGSPRRLERFLFRQLGAEQLCTPMEMNLLVQEVTAREISRLAGEMALAAVVQVLPPEPEKEGLF